MDDQPDRHQAGPTRDGNGQFARNPETARTDAEAAKLRSSGKSYRQIAEAMGWSHPQSAYDAVKRAMAEVIAEPAADALAFELRRLDEELVRLNVLYDRVVEVLEREHITVSQGHVVYMDNGDTVPDDDWILKAVDRLMRIDDQRRRNGESRRRLLGLDQPAKTQISGGVTYEVVGIDPEALR